MTRELAEQIIKIIIEARDEAEKHWFSAKKANIYMTALADILHICLAQIRKAEKEHMSKIHISQSTIDEMRAMAEANKEYYRLYVNHEDAPCLACLQPFDECDYDQDRFVNDVHYKTKEEAKDALITLKAKAGIPLSNMERLKIAQKEMQQG